MIELFVRLSRRLTPGSKAWMDGASAGDNAGLKRNMPLLPVDSVAGRALVTVIAIMTFLASFVCGGGILIYNAARGWTDAVAQEMTIQVRPSTNRDIEVEVKKAALVAQNTAGIAGVRVLGKRDSESLLEPWLGAGLDLTELPVPRLVVLELTKSSHLDPEGLKRRLRDEVPTATLNDHRLWIERLAIMARTLIVVVTAILILMLVALALAVAFATRGAMAGNKSIVHVLHFVGATDNFVAREFQRHFLQLGLRGGAIGAGSALLTFFILEFLSIWWTQSPEGDQIEVLFGTFALGLIGYVGILLVGLGIALLTGAVSRIIVFRHLHGLE